jgi:hypothetical protein
MPNEIYSPIMMDSSSGSWYVYKTPAESRKIPQSLKQIMIQNKVVVFESNE